MKNSLLALAWAAALAGSVQAQPHLNADGPDSQGAAGSWRIEHAHPTTSGNPFSIAGAYKSGSMAFRRMAGQADLERGMALHQSMRAWVVGANYTVAAGAVLFGYGRRAPEGAATTRQLSIGYAYPLSKRTWLYADASDEKADISVRHIDIGIRSSF